ncbi:MAG: hypothetical protein KJ893_03065 [Candidatus Omnitrophica bacterium]|nr:hypothetical protein [Candidatus Omnitrophota bacterium]MBU4479759.1 hypothetical protein [Candidatus Omnitrophota bacterium]MCG2703282.1 hypothetical protein [Candidatus Omnitrophota bacterium]
MKAIFNFVIAISLLSTATVHADTIKKTAFETIDKGVYSQYEENNRQHIIEIYNQDEWQEFWNQHTSGTFPLPELPEIDFQKYFILIAIDEIRSSGGYTLEIKEIAIDTAFENRPFEIAIIINFPGSAAGTTAALTRPYHIVKIKK